MSTREVTRLSPPPRIPEMIFGHTMGGTQRGSFVYESALNLFTPAGVSIRATHLIPLTRAKN